MHCKYSYINFTKLYSTIYTKMQLSMIIVLFALLLELVEFNETYKIKSYKYYNPHPWRRPRWHPLPKHRKRYHSKSVPSYKYRHYEPEPDYHRYTPYHEETSDSDKPYVIVIQLPQKNGKKNYHSYQRKHVIDTPRDNDYIDDADELKVYQLGN
ncbi:PREDICTED: uncharacterized protein LOC105566239 [Vollenhovia emeryi]|uniref:uncharacterized protein LOC105566239 n=1 Tax=Vollenhovia emeryi TaxID=411798 RepID=UPI0005F4CB5A|nr:PREDICTED: uncharacterized protein LOC105566239 [Vollenhovia emeryi]